MTDCWNAIGVRGDGSCPELAKYAQCHRCPVHAAAAARLLDRIPPDEYSAAWTTHFAAPEEAREHQTESAVLFRIGAEWFALASSVVEEVADMRPIHSIPHRRTRALAGITNIRGELLMCVSLAVVLGVEPSGAAKRGAGRPERLLVLRRDDVHVVCPVDEVAGVIRFDRRDLRDVFATLARAATHYSRQLLSWNDRLVGVLDDQLVCYTLKRSLA